MNKNDKQFVLAGVLVGLAILVCASIGTKPASAQQYFTGAGASASGSLTAADATAGTSACTTAKCVNLALGSTNGNVGTAAISVAGTYVGTFIVEGTVDGTNYFTLAILESGVATQTWVTAPASAATGIYLVNVAGMINVQVRCATYTSGTLTVSVRSSAASTP